MVIFLDFGEYAYEEEVMSLINFRVIKIRRRIIYIIISLLILSLAVFFLKNINKNKIVPTFSQINVSNTEKKIIEKVDSEIFKNILGISMPMMMSVGENSPSFINITKITKNMTQFIANVDIFNPESYFSFQIPMINLVKAEATVTPGVEILPETPIPIESEHEPSENPPEVPLEEDEVPEVEKIMPVQDKPLVLIYHSHTSESYTPSKNYNYAPRDKAFHTDDLNYSVAKVGEVLCDELNKLGVPTIHDKTVHDVPTYMTSYANSLKTVERILKENPSIQIIVDLHRDAPVTDTNKSREITTVIIEGKTYARTMFVVGSNKNFPNPNWEENYKFAVIINEALEKAYPGLTRDIDLRKERFNQHLASKALLLEVGSHGNTMEEALETAKAFAKVFAEVVKGLTLNEQ